MSGSNVPKPHAPAAVRNRAPILAELRRWFAAARSVLEIGSGSGQHAVYFAEHLSHLTWQPTDVAENLPGIQAWVQEARLSNVCTPLALDAGAGVWPVTAADAAYTANTLHIVAWPIVARMFAGIGRLLPDGGKFAVYGPFNYNGTYTSLGNAEFDAWLKQRDPASGIRDFENVCATAAVAQMQLAADVPMPSNNRLLIWEKQ